jgi:hypothetical protein
MLSLNCARVWFVYKTGLHQYGVLHRAGAVSYQHCAMKKASAAAGFFKE